MSEVANIIDACLAGETEQAAGPDENTWHSHWAAQGLGGLSPVQMATRGGTMARSLPQVFIAGYQAALRKVFPSLPTEGWAAFVAAEDRDDPKQFPGTTVSVEGDGFRLDGCKSWVGQSRHVAHLMVTAKESGEDRIVFVDRGAPGVSITHRETPSFLSGLSQGFAQFTGVAAVAVPDADMRLFGRTEPQFVMLAGASFLLAGLKPGPERDQAAALTMALAAYAGSGEWAPKTLAALDRQLQALSGSYNGDAVPDWQADRRLFAMYSPRIQKRA